MNDKFVYGIGYISSLVGTSVGLANGVSIVGIISASVSILSAIILTTFKVIDRIRSAKADGKITADEVEDILTIVAGGVKDAEKIADELNKKDN